MQIVKNLNISHSTLYVDTIFFVIHRENIPRCRIVGSVNFSHLSKIQISAVRARARDEQVRDISLSIVTEEIFDGTERSKAGTRCWLAPRWGIGYAQTAFIRPSKRGFSCKPARRGVARRRAPLGRGLTRVGRLSKGFETVAPRRSVSGARPRERAPSSALLHQRRVVGLVKDNI